MPRVRILSGNQTGQVQEVSETEAQNLVATGFAARVVEVVEAEPVPRPSRSRSRKVADQEPEPPVE